MGMNRRPRATVVDPLPEVYTYAEAGAILKMSRLQVRRAVLEGRLGHVALNQREWRVTSDHIREYLAATDSPRAA